MNRPILRNATALLAFALLPLAACSDHSPTSPAQPQLSSRSGESVDNPTLTASCPTVETHRGQFAVSISYYPCGRQHRPATVASTRRIDDSRAGSRMGPTGGENDREWMSATLLATYFSTYVVAY